MKPLLPAVELAARAAAASAPKTSNSCRVGDNLTTALRSRRSLVRAEFKLSALSRPLGLTEKRLGGGGEREVGYGAWLNT